MTDSVFTQVLTGLAQQQRDFHTANQEVQKRTLELTEVIRDDVAEMKTDFALVKRDVDELKMWREKHADPTLGQFRDGVSEAKGAGRLVKAGYAICGLVGGGVLVKFAGAIVAALPK